MTSTPPPSGPPRAVILTGGVAHDFATSTPALAQVLVEAGFAVSVSDDPEAALTALTSDEAPDLLVLNLLRWSMDGVERYADQRERWGLSLSEAATGALTSFVHGGGGLLGLHGASICFDTWAGWRDLLGGTWRWGTSTHPPLDGPVPVRVSTGAHPVVAGSGDFEVVDEVYGFLDLAEDVVGLAHSPHGGADHPLLWARQVGAGRVVYDALGHDERAYAVAEHRRIVRRGARWAAGLDLDAVA